MRSKTISFCSIFILLTSLSAFCQRVSNNELLTILDIRIFRVPSFSKKQWTIEIIQDTLEKRSHVMINKVLSSQTTSLIAVKFDTDTTMSFTLLQDKYSSSKGTFTLRRSRYEIVWNKIPEQLNKNAFVIATIRYEENEDDKMKNLTDLIVIELIDELKF